MLYKLCVLATLALAAGFGAPSGSTGPSCGQCPDGTPAHPVTQGMMAPTDGTLRFQVSGPMTAPTSGNFCPNVEGASCTQIESGGQIPGAGAFNADVTVGMTAPVAGCWCSTPIDCSTASVPTAPADLGTTCTTGSAECLAACMPASPCNQCAETLGAVCSTYAACAALTPA